MKITSLFLCAAAIFVAIAPGCLAGSDSGGEHTDNQDDSLEACTGDSVVQGVDVSDGQGNIDWKAARKAGLGFAVIKATQGTYNTQKTFAANWSNAGNAGVIRAAYHFFDPTEDGVAQAQHFLSVVGPLGPGDLPPMLDLECPDGDYKCLGWDGGTGQAPASAIYQRTLDFLRTVEKATGKKPVIYTFPAYFSSNGVSTAELEQYPLWIAGPSSGSCFTVPSPWPKAVMWQWSWTGSVAGIPAAVDRDRFLGSLADLQAFASGGSSSSGGATHFEPAGPWLTGFGKPDWAAVGDFNGDGKDDIAWYESWNGGAITVVLSTGDGFTVAGKWLTGFGKPDWAAVGDFNGDGKADIAWYESWNGGAITVVTSTGKDFEISGKWLTGWGTPDWAGAGDFDGDGKADIAWYENWNGGSITVGHSTGKSFSYAGKWLSGWGTPDWAGVGDFDGDGKADIAWYEAWNGQSVTLASSTGESFSNRGKWLSGAGSPSFAAAGDFNHDGRADVAFYQASNDHAISVGLSNGGALGAPAAWVSGWGEASFAAAGDFDGDGRKDVAWYEAWNNNGISIGLAR